MSENELNGKTVIMANASGGRRSYPVAEVTIRLDGDIYHVKAAVSSNLPIDVLLGQNIFLEKHLARRRTWREKKELHSVLAEELNDGRQLAVLTRAQVREQLNVESGDKDQCEGELEIATTTHERTEPGMIEEADPKYGDSTEWSQLFPFENEVVHAPGKSRHTLTRKQRRELNWKRTQESDILSVDQLIVQQKVDPEIQEWRSRERPQQMTSIQGVLCRKWKPGTSEELVQVVLPKSQRGQVLELAHNVPMAGHRGQERTLQRICGRFWWPGLKTDVKQYVRSCSECQTMSRREQKVPILQMPIMKKPFERNEMDVVGPLPTSSTRKQYILVICDYFTRYPAAYALRRITAVQVVEKLMEFLQSMEFPRKSLQTKELTLLLPC